MKKAFKIVLILVFVATNTQVLQIIKFPVFVQHYYEHKAAEPDMTIFSFIAEHYNNHLQDHPLNYDYEQDQKLPFISFVKVLNVIYVSTEQNISELYFLLAPDKSNKPLITRSQFEDNNYPSSIWKPPKFGRLTVAFL